MVTKPSFLQRAVNSVWHATHPATADSAATEATAVDDLKPFAYAGSTGPAPVVNTWMDGEKFFGGFGATELQTVDYWTLRQRSAQLFNENLYARGLIRRLITNEINTGLTPEAAPDEQIIGVAEDSLNDWTELTENRFNIWGKQAEVCDHHKRYTFGAIQRAARAEALIAGDVLVVLRISPSTRMPTIQLVPGEKVRTPLGGNEGLRVGHTITYGVEQDASGRVVAHWVTQADGGSKRLPAFGARTGRRISWLVYGTDKRLGDVRGQPLLSLVMQSLKEVDRYRDSAQRKAVVNSILAMYIKKTEAKAGTLPVSNGAVRRDTAQTTDGDGTPRQFNLANQIPGVVMEELQQGEEPVGFHSQGTDVNFGEFERALIQSVAWANEVPPEILTLAFSNNYSASQAAINEFKIYLNKIWTDFGETFCSPIYQEWLISEALQQKIRSPGMLEAWRDPQKYDVFGAWTTVDWYGSIKPSTDMLKQVKASDLLVAGGNSTRAREARITTGTKFSKNVKRLKRENQLLADAMRPTLELEREFAGGNGGDAAGAIRALKEGTASVLSLVEDMQDGSA
jgi:capsid protein